MPSRSRLVQSRECSATLTRRCAYCPACPACPAPGWPRLAVTAGVASPRGSPRGPGLSPACRRPPSFDPLANFLMTCFASSRPHSPTMTRRTTPGPLAIVVLAARSTRNSLLQKFYVPPSPFAGTDFSTHHASVIRARGPRLPWPRSESLRPRLQQVRGLGVIWQRAETSRQLTHSAGELQ